MADTLSLKCNRCGGTYPIVEELAEGKYYCVVSFIDTGAPFLTVHRNGCYQAEVEAGNPPKLTEMFSLTEEGE